MAKTTLHSTPSLVDVLLGATAADLESIQATVAELERELAELVTDKSRQIDSLKAAAKLLGVRLHGTDHRINFRTPNTEEVVRYVLSRIRSHCQRPARPRQPR